MFKIKFNRLVRFHCAFISYAFSSPETWEYFISNAESAGKTDRCNNLRVRSSTAAHLPKVLGRVYYTSHTTSRVHTRTRRNVPAYVARARARRDGTYMCMRRCACRQVVRRANSMRGLRRRRRACGLLARERGARSLGP